MSRMLKALQQVGRVPDSGETVQPLTREELTAFGLCRPEDPQVEGTAKVEAEPPPGQQPERALPWDRSAGFDGVDASEESAVTAEEPAPGGRPAARSELDRFLDDAVRRRQRQYCDLADSILAGVAPGRPAALLFTHVGDFEESPALVADLSVAMSRRVTGELIVVDADFQIPRLSRYLGAESDRALPDVLLGVADWREVVQRTKTARLSLLPGGQFVAGGGATDVSRMGLLLDALRCHYDLVLLQGASANHPEVGVLARHSDATYLTVTLGHVSRRQIRRAVSVLQRSGGALMGGVVIG